MATLDWPQELRPSTMTMALVSNTRVFRSKYSGAVQTARTPGSRWKIVMSFNNLPDNESRILEALRTALDGSAGRVYCWDFGRQPYVVGGTPRVNGVNQMGGSLNTDGWPPGIVVLRRGDYFQVGAEMKQMVEDVTSTASGEAVLVFGPPLRRPPADNTDVNVTTPSAVFLSTDSEIGVDRQPAFVNSISLTLEEDVV